MAPAPAAAVVKPAAPAHTDAGRFYVGPIVGAHVFAKDLELGVADDGMDATAPSSLALFGVRAGVDLNRWLAVEGEADFIPTSDRYYSNNVIVIGARLHLLGYLMKPGKVRPFLLAGAGTLAVVGSGDGIDKIGNDADFAPHWGAGVRVELAPTLALRVDGRHILAPNTTKDGVSSDFELSVGIALAFGTVTKTVYVEHDVEVKPPPVADSDKDFIPDDKDHCPQDPEDQDGYMDDDGCPDPDNDGDGILDAADKCPLQAETKNGIDDDDGCPETDGDGDGLVGSADKCPEQPEDKDGFQDADGCPDPDNDQDGVLDPNDKCPTEMETKNGYKDDDGCADEVPKEVKKYTGVMAGITFKQNSADIAKSSFPLLDRAAKILGEYPDLKIEISGHTSDEGERDFNVNLSLQRADAVKTYLVSKGVAADRITTVGKGPDEPIADNKTRKGREKNRRIEFKLVTQ